MDDTFTIDQFARCYSEAVRHQEEEITISSPVAPFRAIANPRSVYDDFYNGEHYNLMPKMGAWRSKPTKNISRTTVDSNTTFLTDSRPRLAVLPQEGGDEQIAELVSAVVDYWQDRTDFDIIQHGAIKLSRKFGIGYVGLFHEDDADIKDVPYVIHPDAVLVDPDCVMENFDPTYLIYEHQIQYGELLDKYKKTVDSDTFDVDWHPAYASFWTRLQKSIMPNRDVKNPATSVTVYRMWTKDTSRIVWDEDLGDSTVTKAKKKYPNGHYIVFAGGQKLEDRESEYDHGGVPITPFFADMDPGRYCPMGDIQNILPQQVYRNRIMQLLIDSLVKAGGWIALVNPRFLKASQLTNDPVQVHEVGDVNNALKIESFGGLSRHEFNLIAVLDRDADDMAGIHEMSRGVSEPGNKTAQEVAIIAESDKTRIRSCARLVAWSNKRVLRQLLSNLAQWGDFDWMVRIAGEGGTELKVPVDGDLFKRTNEKGKLTKETIKFDLKTDDQSMLPSSQRDKSSLYMQLFQMFAGSPTPFPTEELFEALGVPKSIAAKMVPPPPPPLPDVGGAPPMGPDMSGAPPMGPPMGGPSDMPPASLGEMMQSGPPMDAMQGAGAAPVEAGVAPSPEVIAIMQQTGMTQQEAEQVMAGAPPA